MAKIKEVVSARVAAYSKMEEYGKMSSKGEGGFNEFLSIFSKEEGFFYCYLLHVLFFILFLLLAAFALMFEMALIENVMALKLPSLRLPIFIGTLTVFYFSFLVYLNKEVIQYKKKEKKKSVFRVKAKELKIEMDALFVVYDNLLNNLDVDEYISKNESFFNKLSNQEMLVLKEYKANRKKRPSNDLVEFFRDDKGLRNKSQVEILND